MTAAVKILRAELRRRAQFERTLLWLFILVAVMAAAAMLAGCVTRPTFVTPQATIDRAADTAEIAYQGTVSGLDTAMVLGVISGQTHDDLWRRAWRDLQNVRMALKAGHDATSAMAMLTSDKVTAWKMVGVNP